MALLGTALMLLKSKTIMSLTASGIYGGCMCLLFFASSLHHTVKRPASIQAHLPAYFRESESEKRARERESLSVCLCVRARARACARESACDASDRVNLVCAASIRRRSCSVASMCVCVCVCVYNVCECVRVSE